MIQQPIVAEQVNSPPPISSSLISQFRFARKYMRDPLQFVTDMFEQYGDFVIQWIGTFPLIFTRDPDVIHDVLVTHAASFHKSPDYRDENRGLARFLGQGLLTSEGELWRRQRKLIQPAMHPRRIEAYADTMVTLTRQTIANWQDGAVLDINRQMMQLTLKIIARTMFSTDVTREVNTISHALDFFQTANNTVDIFPDWVPTPLHMRWPKVMNEFNTIIHQIIQHRRNTGAENFNDLLSMLLLAVDENGVGMSDKQLRDEVATIMLAGHETTANAMNWTLYLLAKHPEVEARLHEEVDRVLGGRPATLADFEALSYTEMIIKESMRLYPPAWGIGREIIEDVTIQGHMLPKGGQVSIPIWSLHRHPDYWDEPEQFNPDRFSPENEKRINKRVYLPFGNGARICIGNHFALMEARLLLATIAQQYRLRLNDGQQVKPEPMITLRPKGGLPMRIERR